MQALMRHFVRAVGAFALVLAVALPGAANATVQVAGTGEPAYTKGTNNTYWFTYAGAGFDAYRLTILYSKDGVTSPQYLASGNLAGNASGTTWWNFTAVPGYSLPLADGSSYGGCIGAQDWYSYLGPITSNTSWVPALGTSSCQHGGIVNKRTVSTIDRNVPSISVSVNGTDQFTRSSPLNVSIAYSDPTSPPWFNSTPGLGANQICVRSGGNPATVCNGQPFNYDPACSTISGLQNKPQTSFACQITLDGTVPDGPVTLCAKASDAAVPDNPNTSNQLQLTNGNPVSSTDANVSAPACGYVVLDRTAPQLSVGGPATASVGQLVQFTSGGSDATSGLSNQWTWNFGDNTPETTGATGSHTYTQAGTYQVKLTSKDIAGNGGEATKTITVSGPAATPTPAPVVTPTPKPGATPSPGATPAPGTGGGTGTGTGGTTPAPTTGSTGGTVTTVPTAQQVTQAAGGGTAVTRTSGVLDVIAPKSVKTGRKKISLALTSDVPGTAQITLVRSGRIRSKGSVTFTAAGTIGFDLKLPKGLTVGKYDLRVVLTPTGGGKPSIVKLSITFSKPKGKAKAASAGGDVRSLDPHPGLPAPGVDPALALARP